MVLRIGVQQPDDPSPVFSRSGWRIPREVYKPQQDTAWVKTRSEGLMVDMAKNHKTATIRSVSGYPYNCVGMIFAARRAWIEIDHIYEILNHDGYRQIARESVKEGDVLLYRDRGQPTHVALVVQVLEVPSSATLRSFLALSKWGQLAEFVHRDDQVAAMCGIVSEYYTERL